MLSRLRESRTLRASVSVLASLMLVLAIEGLVLAKPSTTYAADRELCDTQSVPLEASMSDRILVFDQFNPDLGTLKKVTYVVEGGIRHTVQFMNPLKVARDMVMQYQMDDKVTLWGPVGDANGKALLTLQVPKPGEGIPWGFGDHTWSVATTGTLHLDGYDGIPFAGSDTSQLFPYEASGKAEGEHSSGSDFRAFQGTGTVSFKAKPWAHTMVGSSSGAWSVEVRLYASLKATVCYLYEGRIIPG